MFNRFLGIFISLAILTPIILGFLGAALTFGIIILALFVIIIVAFLVAFIWCSLFGKVDIKITRSSDEEKE